MFISTWALGIIPGHVCCLVHLLMPSYPQSNKDSTTGKDKNGGCETQGSEVLVEFSADTERFLAKA